MSTVMPLSAMMPFEDIQFQLVDLPPIGNESTDGWVSAILRSANILIFVVDLSEEPEIQTELLLEQLADWKIPVIKLRDSNGEKASPFQKTLIIAANKSDLPGTGGKLITLKERYESLYPVTGLSAKEKSGIEEMRNSVFEHSRIIRVYAKQPGKKPDMDTPFTLPVGSHVLVLAETIHKDFVENFKYACIWGSVKFDGQRVQKDYILHDGDIVEYHAR
jgi:ribosome-interacting GTPase 1